MATWNDIPEEIRLDILRRILSNRRISKICSYSDCNVCPDRDRQSDYLSIRLVSKDFANAKAISKILFSSATGVLYHASHLGYINKTSNPLFPSAELRRLRIAPECIPVPCRTSFSTAALKNLLPELQVVDIRTASPLRFYLHEDDDFYPHVYEAARLSKARKGHLNWTEHTVWPRPNYHQICFAKVQDYVFLSTHPNEALTFAAPHSILASSLDVHAIFQSDIRVNPYLTAWHARLLYDALPSGNPPTSSPVEVHVQAKIELHLYPPVMGASVFYTVPVARISSADMMLRFQLGDIEVLIPQVLDQPWFDKEFESIPDSFWDEMVEVSMRRRPSKPRSKSHSPPTFESLQYFYGTSTEDETASESDEPNSALEIYRGERWL